MANSLTSNKYTQNSFWYWISRLIKTTFYFDKLSQMMIEYQNAVNGNDSLKFVKKINKKKNYLKTSRDAFSYIKVN